MNRLPKRFQSLTCPGAYRLDRRRVLRVQAQRRAHLLGRPDSMLGSLSWWLRYVHGLMAAVLLAYVLSPFVVLRIPGRYLRSLLYLPRYAVWKLALGLSPRPSSWVRTAREPGSDGLQEELM